MTAGVTGGAVNVADLQRTVATATAALNAAGGGTGAAPTTATTATTGAAGQPTLVGTGTTATGATVTVMKDANGKLSMTPATGRPEAVTIIPVGQTNPQTLQFGPKGEWVSAFQFTEGHQFNINLDTRDGIATGLANLSRIFGARQERVRLLSNALANDANVTGSFNPVDLQKMSLETTTTQQLSEMQKKIFDSMRDSIQAWLR